MTIEEQERFFARNVALERAKYEPTAKEKIFSGRLKGFNFYWNHHYVGNVVLKNIPNTEP